MDKDSDYKPRFSFDTDKMAYDLAIIYAKAHANDAVEPRKERDNLIQRFVWAYTEYERNTPESLMNIYKNINRVDFSFGSEE